jgi:hypothetical protein
VVVAVAACWIQRGWLRWRGLRHLSRDEGWRRGLSEFDRQNDASAARQKRKRAVERASPIASLRQLKQR